MSGQDEYPGYMKLYRAGELSRRSEALCALVAPCSLCPRRCGVDRTHGEKGYCRAGLRASVASHNAHTGEEPPISGTQGSGTVFFAHCTMRCRFCQNFPISQLGNGREATESELAGYYLELQRRGCHNLNLVTPTHYLHAIISALVTAIGEGFRLPIVYNTSGYESVETLALLDGVVDIYMPDMKYADPAKAARFSDAADYVERNLAAVVEMHRQVGDLVCDENGLAQRGLLIRHLILPESEDDSISILATIRDKISPTAFVSLMSQYFPAHRAAETPPLDRRVEATAYDRVVGWIRSTDLRGWIQPMSL